MTATYVAVTAGAVLLTEPAIFGVAALSPPTPPRPSRSGPVQATAGGLAGETRGTPIAESGQLPAASARGRHGHAGQAQPDGNGGVVIPQTTTPECDLGPVSFGVVVSRSGTVLGSTYPACFPAGSQGADAEGGTPRKVLTLFRWPVQSGGQLSLPSGHVVWAATPIVLAAAQARQGGAAPHRRSGCPGLTGKVSACSTCRSPPRRRVSAGSPCHRV